MLFGYRTDLVQAKAIIGKVVADRTQGKKDELQALVTLKFLTPVESVRMVTAMFPDVKVTSVRDDQLLLNGPADSVTKAQNFLAETDIQKRRQKNSLRLIFSSQMMRKQFFQLFSRILKCWTYPGINC